MAVNTRRGTTTWASWNVTDFACRVTLEMSQFTDKLAMYAWLAGSTLAERALNKVAQWLPQQAAAL
jgi:hypothetical protein